MPAARRIHWRGNQESTIGYEQLCRVGWAIRAITAGDHDTAILQKNTSRAAPSGIHRFARDP
jgi:hypothetical protein